MTQDQKLIALKKAVTNAEDALKKSSRDKIMEAFDALEKANKELSDYEDSLVTPEQREAQKRYDTALDAFNAAKEQLTISKNKLIELGLSSPKTHKEYDTSTHSAKPNGYEIAQKIREELSKGAKVSDLATKYGVSTSAVGYYKNYLQHKLKRGDTAWTPLTNVYYPLGAPYEEDNVAEDASKYKVKNYTLADLYNDFIISDDSDYKKSIARKYAMSVDTMTKTVEKFMVDFAEFKSQEQLS